MSTAALARFEQQSPALNLLPSRPALRVIEGGRAPSRVAQRASFRRRRLLAAVLVLLVAAAAFLLVGAISTGLAGGGHPSSVAGASSPTSADAASAAGVAAPIGYRVVQPGDTLWSIAAEIAPHTDVRRTVDRLVEVNGDGPLTVGQRLQLP